MSIRSNLGSLRNERSLHTAACRKKATELLYEANRFELANIATEILLHFPYVSTVQVSVDKQNNWLYVEKVTNLDGTTFDVHDIASVNVFFESMEAFAVMDFTENGVLDIPKLSRLIPPG